MGLYLVLSAHQGSICFTEMPLLAAELSQQQLRPGGIAPHVFVAPACQAVIAIECISEAADYLPCGVASHEGSQPLHLLQIEEKLLKVALIGL